MRMELTADEAHRMLREFFGFDFDHAHVERLLPGLARHIELLDRLDALDIGGDDPRTMYFANDWRVNQ